MREIVPRERRRKSGRAEKRKKPLEIVAGARGKGRLLSRKGEAKTATSDGEEKGLVTRRGGRVRGGDRNWNKNEGSYRWRLDLSFDSTLLEKLHLSPAAFALRVRYGIARKSAPRVFTRDQILC